MKVHFAGNTCGTLYNAGVRYRLESFYDITVRRRSEGIAMWNRYKHVIIDSGLFTLMFGSEAKKGINEQFCEDWMARYVEFIRTTPFENASFVELDVQKKLSPEIAWEYRRRLRSLLPDARIINVYHLEDENPDRLIDFADYIAVSIPEFRFASHVSDQDRYAITRYISRKAKARGKAVHLLGCTEKRYMRDFSYCDTCDSTSWQSPFRWGRVNSSEFGQVKLGGLRSKMGEGATREAEEELSAAVALVDYRKYAGDQT